MKKAKIKFSYMPHLYKKKGGGEKMFPFRAYFTGDLLCKDPLTLHVFVLTCTK